MDDRFELIESFIVVAQKLSFVEAADSLQIDPSALSRRIQRLEKRLNVRLFNRSTRHVALTEAGISYFSHCTEVLAKLDYADAIISHLSAEPRGLLRVTLPVSFGQRQIAPVLPEFLDRYPQIDLDLSFTNQYVEILEESIDVAIRIGQMQDSQLVVHRLAISRRVLCASPTYLQKYGSPQTPKELAQHNCLNFSRLATGDLWHLSRQNQRVAVPVKGKLRANSGEALYQVVLGGCGIALLETFMVGGAPPSLQSFRLSTRGFKELASVSHLGPAVATLLNMHALDRTSDRWRSCADRLLQSTLAARAANSTELWQDKIAVEAFRGREAAIAAMMDYGCALTIRYLKAVLADESKLTSEFLRKEYLEAEGDAIGATVPFNAVMIGTFFLTGLDTAFRITRWFKEHEIDWQKAMLLICGQQGRPTAGVTWTSNSICQMILSASNHLNRLRMSRFLRSRKP